MVYRVGHAPGAAQLNPGCAWGGGQRRCRPGTGPGKGADIS